MQNGRKRGTNEDAGKRPLTSNPPNSRDKFFGDPDRPPRSFEAVEVFGNISDACEMVGVSRTVVHDERDRNAEFATLLVKAKRQKHFKPIKTITDNALEGPKGKPRPQAGLAGRGVDLRTRELGPLRQSCDPNAVTPEMMSRRRERTCRRSLRSSCRISPRRRSPGPGENLRLCEVVQVGRPGRGRTRTARRRGPRRRLARPANNARSPPGVLPAASHGL